MRNSGEQKLVKWERWSYAFTWLDVNPEQLSLADT